MADGVAGCGHHAGVQRQGVARFEGTQFTGGGIRFQCGSFLVKQKAESFGRFGLFVIVLPIGGFIGSQPNGGIGVVGTTVVSQ